MPARILDGKVLSAEVLDRVTARVAALKEKGIVPGLAVILVGNDPASEIYVRNKGIACEQTGMRGETVRLPEDIPQETLEREIDRLNRDETPERRMKQPANV